MIDDSLPTLHDDGVAANDIRWTTLDPLPRLELLPAGDLLGLDAGSLLEYAYDLQRELEAVRALLHESLGALALAHHQRDRLQTRLRQVLDALHAARETIRALGADLRACQEREP